MICPHCHKSISASQIASALARSGSETAGRPKTIKPCPKCGQRFGALELRKHIPHCHRQPMPA
jgi:transcriptional regulator NrdR family protein